MISIQIPAVHDNSGKATSIRDACAAVVQEYKPTAPSLRQQWLCWMDNRKKMEAEGTQGSFSRPAPRQATSMPTRHSSRGSKSHPPPDERPAEPEESPLMRRRQTLMSKHAKVDVGELLFTKQEGTVRLTEYRSELPGSKLQAELYQARAELREEGSKEGDDDRRASSVEEEPQSLQEREGEMNEYLITACATGVVHQWALDRQIQCDKFEV